MARLKHKRGRKSNYVKSLDNDYHREVRRKVMIRDGFQCRFPGCNCRINLELHHITYFVDVVNIVGKELDYLEWMVMLCEGHHEDVHKDINHIWNPKNRNKRPIK